MPDQVQNAKYEMPDGSFMIAPEGTRPDVLKTSWEIQKLKGEYENIKKAHTNKEGNFVLKLDPNDPNSESYVIGPQLQHLENAIADRKSKLEKLHADNGDFIDKLLYRGKQVGSSIVKGVGSVAAAPASMIKGASLGGDLDYATSPMQQLSNVGLKPQTTGEKYADSIVQGVSGAMTGTAGLTPVRAAVVGGGSGLGAEIGGQVTNDNPLGRLVGGLVGGLTPSALGSLKTTRGALAQETIKGVPEDALRAAQAEMQAVKESGLGEINLSQAMKQPSGIDSTVAALANSRNGEQVQRQLRQQPQEAAFAAETAAATLPGVQRSPQMAANNMQESASTAIKQEYEKAGQLWQEKAPQGSEIPTEAVAALDAKLKALAAKYPNTSGADLINDARGQLVNPVKPQAAGPQILGPNGQPINPQAAPNKYLTDALQLKGALEDSLSTFGSRKLNTSGLDATNSRRAQEVRTAFRSVLDQYAPKLREADAAYSNHLESVVAPLKQSEIGRIAGKQGYSDDTEAAISKVHALFEKGTVPGAKNSEILSAQKALAKTPEGNRVFQDAFQTWFRGKLSKAVETTDNRFPEDAASRLAKVFGNPEQPSATSQGMQDSLAALARSRGVPEDQLVKGFSQVQKFLAAAARRPGTVGDSRFDVKAAAQGTNQELLRTNENSILAGLRVRFRSMKEDDAYRFMDKLVTTPEGIDTLIKLGKAPPLSPTAANLLSTMMGTEANMDSPQ